MSDLRVSIRIAAPTDLDSLVSLLAALFSIEQDFVFDASRQRRGLELMLENERGCVLVAEGQGQVIGMCTGQVAISTAEGGPALLVEDVIVLEQWRGKGVGRQLLENLGAWAREQGIERFQLLADRNNGPALDFYEALGWQATALVCLRKTMA